MSLHTSSAARRDQRIAHPGGEAGRVGWHCIKAQPQRGGTGIKIHRITAQLEQRSRHPKSPVESCFGVAPLGLEISLALTHPSGSRLRRFTSRVG
jgi:hypothetical protein